MAAVISLAWLCASCADGYAPNQAPRILDFSMSQQEALKAFSLLAAVAESATDSIFAKDLQGRYLMFNHACAKATGMTAAQALGQDDRVLFAPDEAAAIMANDARVMRENLTLDFEEEVSHLGKLVTTLST